MERIQPQEAFLSQTVLPPHQLAVSRRYFWKLLIDLLDYHFVHLALLTLLLFHHDALQGPLQVSVTVLVLQVWRRPDNRMHQRQVFHSQLREQKTSKRALAAR